MRTRSKSTALHANFVKNPKKSVPSISAISELSIVGAEYMAIALNDSDSGVEIFKCMLCNKVRHGLTDDAVRHLISLEHRMNYLRRHFPLIAAEHSETRMVLDTDFTTVCTKICDAIEQAVGRKEWTVLDSKEKLLKYRLFYSPIQSHDKKLVNRLFEIVREGTKNGFAKQIATRSGESNTVNRKRRATEDHQSMRRDFKLCCQTDNMSVKSEDSVSTSSSSGESSGMDSNMVTIHVSMKSLQFLLQFTNKASLKRKFRSRINTNNFSH